MRRWTRNAARADTMPEPELLALRDEARKLSARIDSVLHQAEIRLGPGARTPAAIRRPLHSDWTWRPEIWTRPLRPSGLAGVADRTAFGSEARVFHDCPRGEVGLRQIRDGGGEGAAAFGLGIDILGFDGSFLSVVVDLPRAACDGLTGRHVLGLALICETEAPARVYARLNLAHGPNVAQLVREVAVEAGADEIDFDLATASLDGDEIERAWLDLILERPRMNRILVGDLTMFRRPRAEI